MAKTILAVDDSSSLRQTAAFRLNATIWRRELESSTARIVFAIFLLLLFFISAVVRLSYILFRRGQSPKKQIRALTP